MDEEIEGNLPLTRQRLHKASTSALLIVIMSDFYLDSDWCKDEAAWFEEADGGWANTDGRIFVVKTSRTDPNR